MCTDSSSVGRICKHDLLQILLRAINLIGKGLSCRESRYRIVADIARKYLYNLQIKEKSLWVEQDIC